MNVDHGIERVRSATSGNEPLVRLWQQQYTRPGHPLRAEEPGSGLGSVGRGSSHLPHGLYVFSRDRQKAIWLIKGTDSPEYIQDSAVAVRYEE